MQYMSGGFNITSHHAGTKKGDVKGAGIIARKDMPVFYFFGKGLEKVGIVIRKSPFTIKII